MEYDNCHTRYPIVLIHGTGFRDWRGLRYWGRIPETLEKHGAKVFFGNQDGWATVEKNAAALKERVEEILAETGSEKWAAGGSPTWMRSTSAAVPLRYRGKTYDVVEEYIKMVSQLKELGL